MTRMIALLMSVLLLLPAARSMASLRISRTAAAYLSNFCRATVQRRPLAEQPVSESKGVGPLHAILLFDRGNALVEDSTWLELRQRTEEAVFELLMRGHSDALFLDFTAECGPNAAPS